MSAADPENAALAPFSAATRNWFLSNFDGATAVQAAGWSHISKGRNTLLLAPTGSGKTLAALLWAIDRLIRESTPPTPLDSQLAGAVKAGGAHHRRAVSRDKYSARSQTCKVLYVSPLKALTADIERNLRAPLAGIALQAQHLNELHGDVRVAVRTGDTSPAERRRQLARPPEILVTTPESLYLLLTSTAQDVLHGVQTVIVDEIHALVGTKRGAHLALSLERLERLVVNAGNSSFQRIGCSATQRPIEEAARYLGGQHRPGGAGSPLLARPVEVANAGITKQLDLEVVLPVDDLGAMGSATVAEEDLVMAGPAAGNPEMRSSIWPHMHPMLVDLVRSHKSTLIFVNSRRLAERLAAKLNEISGEELARAHHGSLAREQRVQIEEELKAGQLPALVATSSLELGIDMGAIDLVIQVEAPSSVASGLQRVGRAGHKVDAASIGKIFPKYRHDLLVAAVCVDLMHQGSVESVRVPRNPLDILAQQTVAMAVAESLDRPGGVLSVEELLGVVEGAYSFADCPKSAIDAVLDLCSGRYPSDQFADLRPRVFWDRIQATLRARGNARMVALTNGGTIADRGTYGVFTPAGSRVGELDEEMVYECRVGETFLLGASSWRILDITRDRVVAEPAPGVPGKMPFWHGDQPGRPYELGQAIGKFLREFDTWEDKDLAGRCGLSDTSIKNLRQYLHEEREATGGLLPSDTQIVVERFRDEIGDWRICLLSPFGSRVHAPWAMAVEANARQKHGMDVQAIWSDDGIVLRLPDGDDEPDADLLFIDPDEIRDLVVSQLADTPLFAARFRENAARSLLLPRRMGGSRSPLWLQRQKAANLLAIAREFPNFPVLVETYRECLSDLFELDALVKLMRDVVARKIHVATVDLPAASPFAASLVFSYIANFIYEGDAPLAERRAQALVLDRKMLAQLLGSDEMRELIDEDALETLESELAGLAESRRAKDPDAAADLLWRLGDMTPEELALRCHPALGTAQEVCQALVDARRAYLLRIAGEDRLVVAQDVGRYRDALGVMVPPGVPEAYLQPVDDALLQLLRRWARTHGPFVTREPAERFGVPVLLAQGILTELQNAGTIVQGEFRPRGRHQEWCDSEVLRLLRQRSIAALRKEIAPVDSASLCKFLPEWHGIRSKAKGIQRCWQVAEQLQGYPMPASIFESDIFSVRVGDYSPSMLDELVASGDLIWVGSGSLGRRDGRVVLLTADLAPALLSRLSLDSPSDPTSFGPEHDRLRTLLAERGACFFRDMLPGTSSGAEPGDTLHALWDLVWRGEVTNDSFSALRSLTNSSQRRHSGTRLSRRFPGRQTLRDLGARSLAGSQGRWSLVSTVANSQTVDFTEATTALVEVLLDRHGILTRESLRTELVPGGFASLYPVLSAMEQSGRLRRGYFVEGLGAAQFALPSALENLRSVRQVGALRTNQEQKNGAEDAVILAASDPANQLGGALQWPERGASRSAGARVIFCDGVPSLYLERGAHSLISLRASTKDNSDESASIAWEPVAIRTLISLVSESASRQGPVLKRLVLRKFNEQMRPWLIKAGFVQTPAGLEFFARLDRRTIHDATG